MIVLIFSTNFFRIIYDYVKSVVRYYRKCTFIFMYISPFLLSILMKH